jgi:ubiquinone/menaquinone biosynthesis C-methylase UbiE
MSSVKLQDDFEWQNVYPSAHFQQTQQLEQDILFEIPIGSIIENGKVHISTIGKDIHINHRMIFEKIIEVLPQSVFEIGFGYGNNLVGIHRLLPQIELSGCDISWKQHYMALQRYEECKKFNLVVGDFLELDIPDNSFDFVFSQAVLMHMSTERAMRSLEKMVRISKKYIMSTDGGLVIPNIREFLQTLGKVDFICYDKDIEQKYAHINNISPFVIEKI